MYIHTFTRRDVIKRILGARVCECMSTYARIDKEESVCSEKSVL